MRIIFMSVHISGVSNLDSQHKEGADVTIPI